jgi:DNA-binding NarL/FixJ family response regulator
MAEHAEHEVRVLVVDDQDPFRRAMAAVVEATDGFVVVGAVASGEESVDAVRTMKPAWC